MTLGARLQGALPPVGPARPGPARRGRGAHGAGGGAGRRRGAAALLPVAAVHGGAGAAAWVSPTLVPPHRRGRAARGAAAAGPHPRGKAGAAGRAGPGREERRSLTVPVPAAGGGGERARRGHPHRGLRDPVPLFFPPGEPRDCWYPPHPGRVSRRSLSRHK